MVSAPVNKAEQDEESIATGPLDRGTVTIIAVLICGAFVMFLNETVLSVALKTLSTDFDLPTSTIQWVTSVFLLGMAVVIPTTGYLLERFSERQVFGAAGLFFSAGSVLCGLAPNFEVLIAGRILQSVGTAMILPLLMTTVMRLVPVDRRGSVIGSVTVVTALAPALGPTTGGLVVDSLGWRWLFWLGLPLMAVVLVIGWIKLPKREAVAVAPLDLISVPLTAIGFGGLLYGLAGVGEGHVSTLTWVALVFGLLALCVFVMRQLKLQRTHRALLDLRAFLDAQFRLSTCLVALLFLCMMSVTAVLLPLFLQGVQGRTAVVSGLVLLPGGLALGLMGPVVGRIYDRSGGRWLVIIGAGLFAASLLVASTLRETSPLWVAIAMYLLLMSAVGAMMAPLFTDALSALPEDLYSHGSAIIGTIQQVGGALGIALFVSIATVVSAAGRDTPDIDGIRAAFAVMAIVGVGIFVLATRFGAKPRRKALSA